MFSSFFIINIPPPSFFFQFKTLLPSLPLNQFFSVLQFPPMSKRKRRGSLEGNLSIPASSPGIFLSMYRLICCCLSNFVCIDHMQLLPFISHFYFSIVLLVDTSFYWNIGPPSWNCQHCGAMMWYEERIKKSSNPSNPRFTLCCSRGRVMLPYYSYPPQLLCDLYHESTTQSKIFQNEVRSFNTMFAFTSMGGKIVKDVNQGRGPPIFIMNGENYHQIGSLLPPPGAPPKFAQLYVYDTDNEVNNRMSVVR